MLTPSPNPRGTSMPKIVIKPGGLVILTVITTISVVGAVNVVKKLQETPVAIIGNTSPLKQSQDNRVNAPALANPPKFSGGIPIENYSFEAASADPTLADRWRPYGTGYSRDTAISRSGKTSIRLDNPVSSDGHGAVYILMLNQTEPKPIEFSAWSKSDGVRSEVESGYSIYIDVEYTDGTTLYGTYAAYQPGKHDWQHQYVQIRPKKPIRHAKIFLLLRQNAGTVWFDDVICKPI